MKKLWLIFWIISLVALLLGIGSKYLASWLMWPSIGLSLFAIGLLIYIGIKLFHHYRGE